MSIFDINCPNCQRSIPRHAEVCPYCSAPLKGGKRICAACGTQNPGDAVYCSKCGEALAQSAAPEINQNRWQRSPGDFAARVDAGDLQGFVKRELIISPGTQALLLIGGSPQTAFEPGTHTLETLGERLSRMLTGAPSKVVALLVDVTPTTLDFHLGGAFTKDPLKVGISLQLDVRIKDANAFLINRMRDQQRYSVEELRVSLYPQVTQVVQTWVASHTVEQLATDLTLRERLEMALDDALEISLQQSGLVLEQVRALEFNLEVRDRASQIQHEYALQISEAEAQAQGKTRLVDATAQLDLAKLRDETLQVEMYEKRLALYDRTRQAIEGDRMKRLRSDADFAQFMIDLDFEGVLRQKERDDLLLAWQESRQDHDLARAHLLAKLDAERRFELRMLDLRQQGEIDVARLTNEQEIARKRANFEYESSLKLADQQLELERKKIELQRERDKAEAERRNLALDLTLNERQKMRSEEEADLTLAELALEKMSGLRRRNKELDLRIERIDLEERKRIDREDELARKRETLELELKKMEAEERRDAARREHELRRMVESARLTVEQLIASAPAEQAQLLSALRTTELLQGYSDTQIMALLHANAPEVMLAVVQKMRSANFGKAGGDEDKLYEWLKKN